MDFYIDQLRTSTHLKNILSRVKTRTGIQNMNVICRWGFCLSLKQTSLPRDIDEKLDGVTIDYDTFAGKNKIIYTQLLVNNMVKHDVEITRRSLAKYLNSHVNRGINIIYNNKLKSIVGLLKLTSSKD